MTIWVFGDSFTELYPDLKLQYTQILAREYNTNVIGYGLSASSIEYTYYKFNTNRHLIKENDIVIVGLTSFNRRWFFKYYPGNLVKIYNPGTFDDYSESLNSPSNNPKEIEALTAYADNLNHKELQEDYIKNFLHNLNYLSKERNLTTIVFLNLYDTFNLMKNQTEEYAYLRFAKNMLLDISLGELSKEYVTNFDQSIYDLRVNHITTSNHIRLANQIIDNIDTNKEIDCAMGFKTNTISFESIKDEAFINEELFGGYLLRLR